jgi:spermidine synthase
VIAVATDPSLFTLLSACAPDAAIVRGDARLSLAEEPDQNFDVLVVDAFSSDAIPVHLLTREALALYVRKLRPDGVIVMHISNRFMELASVVAAGAAAEGLS